MAPTAQANVSTLEAEREHILPALEDAHWISAEQTARRTARNETTLQSRMQKLGLERAKS